MIAIIMELLLPSTTEIYTIFQNLYIKVNIYISKKSYIIITKCFKKNQQRELRKEQMQYDKDNVFKVKKFGKEETVIKKDKYFFMMIATQDNQIESWFLVITNAIYNYFLIFLGVYLIY